MTKKPKNLKPRLKYKKGVDKIKNSLSLPSMYILANKKVAKKFLKTTKLMVQRSSCKLL